MKRNRVHKRSDAIPVREHRRKSDERRGTAASRGYGYQWTCYSAKFLRCHPWCIACGQSAELTDHILPVRQTGERSGGADLVFWLPWNHEPLCLRHHAEKTSRHDARLDSERLLLLRNLRVSAEEHELRNTLLTRARLWDTWLCLSTGRWMMPERSSVSG